MGAALLPACITALTAVLTYRAFTSAVAANASVTHTRSVQASANGVRGSMVEALGSLKGFAATGSPDELRVYRQATAALPPEMEALRALVADNPAQQQRLDAALALFESWRNAIALLVIADRETPADAAAMAAIERSERALIDRPENERARAGLQSLWNDFLAAEQRLLEQRDREQARVVRWAKLVTVVGPLAALLLTFAVALRLALRLRRSVRGIAEAAHGVAEGERGRRAEVQGTAEVMALALTFNEMAATLERREQEAALLHRLADLLASCHDLTEAADVVGSMGRELFPAGGALFLANNSRNAVEPLAVWGSVPEADRVAFHPDDCWALRRGQAYGLSTSLATMLRCRHISAQGGACTLCVPLVAQGDALSLLHLRWPMGDAEGVAPAEGLVRAFSEQVALALANLRLRERLHAQSVRDPLTGLYNRRYLEETLDREMARARRNNLPIGFLVLDVDHFKRFNDTHGHSGGDALLQALGGTMKGHLRREDIACRYGGEEFVLVLPGATLEDARRRAEDLRLTAARLSVSDQGRSLGAVSVSIGVAAFPDHGAEPDQLIRAADAALYEAKHGGRDRVVTAQAGGSRPAAPAVPGPAAVGVPGAAAPAERSRRNLVS